MKKIPVLIKLLLVIIAAAAVFAAFFMKYTLALSAAEMKLVKNAGVPAGIVLSLKREAFNIVFLGSKNSLIRPLIGMDAGGNTVVTRGIAISVPCEISDAVLQKYRPGLKKQGLLLFTSSQDNDPEPDELAIIKSSDQYDILRVMGTCGADYDITNAEIIKKLKAWEKTCSFEITGAESDMLQAVFTRPPEDMDAFADEVFRFCPDAVEQGTENVEGLAEEMKQDNTLYMWWD